MVTEREQDYGLSESERAGTAPLNRMTSRVAAAAYGSNVHLSA
jgi:hypothetical protein